MTAQAAFVAGLGASTSVGRAAWPTAAAVRAGISGLVQHPFMLDATGEPMRAAIAPWLDIELGGVDRFIALLSPAIDQALEPLEPVASNGLRVALSLGLPAPRPGLPADLQPELLKRIGSEGRFGFAAVAAFPNGHAAGLTALMAAAKKLSDGAFDACVVAGVDSYMEPETLEWLEECEQLHGVGPLNNPWGFVPGEGCGAVLLIRSQLADRLGMATLARILGAGSAFEPKRIKTEAVCIGEGLTEAFRVALRAIPDGARVTDVYCDMNGERYRADEFGFACLRTRESFEFASDFIAPADCWGDVGAASGPLSAMLAAVAGVKGYAKGPYSFVWASSEAGDRAAVLIETRQRR